MLTTPVALKEELQQIEAASSTNFKCKKENLIESRKSGIFKFQENEGEILKYLKEKNDKNTFTVGRMPEKLKKANIVHTLIHDKIVLGETCNEISKDKAKIQAIEQVIERLNKPRWNDYVSDVQSQNMAAYFSDFDSTVSRNLISTFCNGYKFELSSNL